MTTPSQVRVVHLSDIHFGRRHRFRAPLTPSGDESSREGYPTLLESLRKDWEGQKWGVPVVIAVTGDVAQDAKADEFAEARKFLDDLVASPVFGQTVTKDQLFLVPGNHDVVFTEPDMSQRWQPYCALYQGFFGKLTDPAKAGFLTTVRMSNHGTPLVVAEINCCKFITKGSKDEQRGQIDKAALGLLEKQLKAIEQDTLKKSIRIALVHHHPVLIPVFAEPDRGYDSIINSDVMLRILRQYGFHLLLHGHKHYPQILTYDAECGWRAPGRNPLTVIAGGSAGSTELPTHEASKFNTYNVIDLKWNPSANEGRVRVRTRGLKIFDGGGEELNPADWRWEDLHVIDRVFPTKNEDSPIGKFATVPFDKGVKPDFEAQRGKMYAKLRGNMPVVEVIPSFAPGQEYEAKVWIEPHPGLIKREMPKEVIWSAGDKFQMCKCKPRMNNTFSAVFGYYGPVLIQARIRFKDDTVVDGYVYAHLPTGEIT